MCNVDLLGLSYMTNNVLSVVFHESTTLVEHLIFGG